MVAPERVLLAVANGGVGGMQVQVGLLAGGLAAAGCEVVVAAGPGPLEVGAAQRVELPAFSAGAAPRVAAALRSIVRRTRPDVVHGHGLRLAPVLAVAGRRRALVSCHGIDPIRVAGAARVVRLSRVAVASCGEGPRRLLAGVGVTSRVLDNAVAALPAPIPRSELATLLGLEPSTLLCVSPARLSDQKDPLTVVRAVAATPGVSCALIGDGPLVDDVRREISGAGAQGRVVVVPWRADARGLLASADALVLASRWEGQPTVVLEAMSAGVAIVATSCVGTADTVVDGVTALLSPVGDHVALGASLGRLAATPELRASLGDRARSQSVAHSPEAMVAAHLAAYRRLLSGEWAASAGS